MAPKARLERYVRIPATVYDSVAFRTLPPSAQKLWLDLRTRFNGNNNGNISATLEDLRMRGWKHPKTLTDAIWVLLERGLLRRTRAGKPGPFRLCSLFSFTDIATAANTKLDIAGCGPTRQFMEWVEGKSFAPEKKATKFGADRGEEKTLLQKAKRYRYGNRSVTGTEIEALTPGTASKNEAVNSARNAPQAAPVVASSQIGH